MEDKIKQLKEFFDNVYNVKVELDIFLKIEPAKLKEYLKQKFNEDLEDGEEIEGYFGIFANVGKIRTSIFMDEKPKTEEKLNEIFLRIKNSLEEKAAKIGFKNG